MPKKTIEQSRRDFLIKSISVAPSLALAGVALNALAPPPAEGAGAEGKADKPREYQPSFFQ